MFRIPYCAIHNTNLNFEGLCTLCIAAASQRVMSKPSFSDEEDMSPMARQIADLNIAVGVLQQEHREQWIRVFSEIEDIRKLVSARESYLDGRIDKLANMIANVECSLCKGRGFIGDVSEPYTCPKCEGEG